MRRANRVVTRIEQPRCLGEYKRGGEEGRRGGGKGVGKMTEDGLRRTQNEGNDLDAHRYRRLQ